VADKKETDAAKPAAQTPKLSTTPARKDKHCGEEACKRPYRAKGYCGKHYRLWRQHKLGKKQRYHTCGKEGCRKPMVRWGMCEEHFKVAQTGAEAAGGAAPA
jgi:hypothetical protein